MRMCSEGRPLREGRRNPAQAGRQQGHAFVAVVSLINLEQYTF